MANLNKKKRKIEAFCEYQTDPLGIQNTQPRFSWRITGTVPSHGQAKYHILVASTPERLREGKADLWDSGEVESDCSTGVDYRGATLKSKSVYWWTVKIWRREKSAFLEAGGKFETGILCDWEWKAKWISHPAPVYGVSPLFRKVFRLDAKPDNARIYFCGLGYYRLYINGERVGDRELEPGWTDYRKRVLYSVYDVTPYLCRGDNALCVELGEGWYGQIHDSIRMYTGRDPAWHSYPKWLMELDIRLQDGSIKTVYTENEDGFFCTDGPIRENSIYDGEVYDAAMEPAGWKQADYIPPPGRWIPAVMAADTPTGNMIAQSMPPIRVLRELPAISEKPLPGGRRVYDFGENFAGWVRVVCRGPQGSSVTVKYAETSFEDGSVNQENLRGAKCRDVYRMAGSGREEYEPRFTYHGFRYVEICMADGAEVLEVSGREVASAVRQTGHFHCSDEVLNWLHEAIIRTERSNLHSIPTDCPQRDERQGWVNDMTVRCEETLFNFDTLLFFEKWMDDLEDSQDIQTGSIPDTVPYIYGGQPAFHISSCYVLLPWLMYRFYGNTRVIENHYESIKKYVKFLYSQAHGGIIGKPYCGDWAPPAAECIKEQDWGATPVNIPAGLITSCYLYYDCRILCELAELVGKPEDISCYESIASEVGQAINIHYYDRQTGGYGTNKQGCNIFPLLLGLAEEKAAPEVLRNLLYDLTVKHTYHITTGNQMTKHLFDLLLKEGCNDVALRVLQSHEYPSFGYMMDNMATTIWERWEKADGCGMNSHNHPMNAACSVWLFKAVGGIRFDLTADGLKTLVLQPDISLPLKYAEASYDSLAGKIGCRWNKNGDTAVVEIEIPWNMKARVVLPGICVDVKSGVHTFKVDIG